MGSRDVPHDRMVEPRLASEQAAYDKWFDERSDREDARADHAHGAVGVIPTPLWIVLFLSTATIMGFMLLFADSGERAFVQATMMGGVAVVVASTLLLLWFLDNPYHGGVDALRPAAMERALDLLQEEARVAGGVSPPCDAVGTARGWRAPRSTIGFGKSLTVVLLGLAAIATAWATFQAAHWRSEQALAGNRSTAARVEANRAAGVANRLGEIDVTTFEQWVDAYAGGDSGLAAFTSAASGRSFARP